MPDDDWGVDELIDKIFVKPTPPPTGPPLPPRTINGNGDHGNNYARKALDDECAALAAMPIDSGRNVACNNAAFNLGQLIATGELDEAEVRWRLAEAMHRNGYMQSDGAPAALKTISSGIAGGKANPRGPRRQLDRSAADSWDIFTGGRPQPVHNPVDAGQADPLNPQFVTAEAGSSDTAVTADHVSTWLPEPLRELTARLADEPEPTQLARQDGHRLFYAHRVNGLIGASESGKTWVALLAVLQAIQVGEQVLYLDFEDSGKGIEERLLAMGATEQQLGLLHYASPDERLDPATLATFEQRFEQHAYTIVVVDGVNAAMTLLGLKVNDQNDATSFAQRILKPLTRTGAAVIYIDHIPKNRGDGESQGAIGAQAKRAMTSGCCLLVETSLLFAQGSAGKIRLTVDKDKRGRVRAVSAGRKHAGDVQVEPVAGEDGQLRMRIEGPDLRPPSERPPATKVEHTVLAERISRFMENTEGAVSERAIVAGVSGNDKAIRLAIEELRTFGYLRRWREQTGLRTQQHELLRPFREAENHPVDPLTAATAANRGQTAAMAAAKQPLPTSATTPLRGGEVAAVDGGPGGTTDDQPLPGSGEQDQLDYSPPRKLGRRGDRVIDLKTGEDVGPAANPTP